MVVAFAVVAFGVVDFVADDFDVDAFGLVDFEVVGFEVDVTGAAVGTEAGGEATSDGAAAGSGTGVVVGDSAVTVTGSEETDGGDPPQAQASRNIVTTTTEIWEARIGTLGPGHPTSVDHRDLAPPCLPAQWARGHPR